MIIFYAIKFPSQRFDESDVKAYVFSLLYHFLLFYFTDIPKLRLTIVGKKSEKLNKIEIKSDDEVKFSCVVKAVPVAYSINWKRNVKNGRY